MLKLNFSHSGAIDRDVIVITSENNLFGFDTFTEARLFIDLYCFEHELTVSEESFLEHFEVFQGKPEEEKQVASLCELDYLTECEF